MGKLIRLLLLIALAPFVYAFAVEAFVFVRANVIVQSITWFLAGLVPCVVIYAVLPHKNSKTIQYGLTPGYGYCWTQSDAMTLETSRALRF